jgi:hypothetical protein
MDLGRPENVELLFRRGQRLGRPTIPPAGGGFKTKIDRYCDLITLNVFYMSSRLKQYLKDGVALRIETVVNDPRTCAGAASSGHGEARRSIGATSGQVPVKRLSRITWRSLAPMVTGKGNANILFRPKRADPPSPVELVDMVTAFREAGWFEATKISSTGPIVTWSRASKLTSTDIRTNSSPLPDCVEPG